MSRSLSPPPHKRKGADGKKRRQERAAERAQWREDRHE